MAATRQKEMKLSITVVAMKTGTAERPGPVAEGEFGEFVGSARSYLPELTSRSMVANDSPLRL